MLLRITFQAVRPKMWSAVRLAWGISFNESHSAIHFSRRQPPLIVMIAAPLGHTTFGTTLPPSAAASAPLFANFTADDCSRPTTFGATLQAFSRFCSSLWELANHFYWFWLTFGRKKITVCTFDQSGSNKQTGILHTCRRRLLQTKKNTNKTINLSS